MRQQQKPQHTQIQFNDSHSFSSLWQKLKNSVFDVLFVLLDNSDEQENMIGLCMQTGVDYLQMMAFPFSSVVINVWNAGNTLNSITNFFNRFNVSTYIPGVGFNTFLLLMYSLIFLIIVVICDIVYVAYSFSKKRFRFTWPLVFLAKIVPLIVTVMFLPIMETLLQVVNCQSAQDANYQVLQTFPDVRCWQGWHLFHTTITLIFSFFFVFISCIVTLALFEPRMTTNRLTARQNSTGEVVFIINKIICQFIFSFSPFNDSLLYCVLLFALSAWLWSTYNITQPYYDKRACKFFRILSTYYFWTNLMLLVSELLAPLGFQDGLVIWVCGIIFIGLTIIFERKSNIDTLFSSSLKFKSGLELQSHLQYVLQLHHNRNEDKNSYMLLLGYIEKHIELCLEQDCPLKYNKIKFMTGKEEEEYSCKQLLKQLERMFIYGIKKYPQCTKLRLTFAFFYMEKQFNTTKAYEHLTKALSTEPSFGEQFIIYRFRKIINEKLEENKQENQESDLIELIRFDNHVALCEQGMLISGKLHKQFWIQLREESPNLDRLNKIGAKIIETCEMVKQNYKEIVRLSNDGLSILELQYNYALYLMFISHETKEGNRLLETIKKKTELRLRKEAKSKKEQQSNKIQQILNTNKSLIVSQLQYQENGVDPCCRIRRVNKQFLELTKYVEQELIDKRLDKVLPKILEDDHDMKIKEWLEIEQQIRSEEYAYKNRPQNEPNSNLENNSNSNSGQNKKGRYIGNRQVGYIKESTGYIAKVRYQVYFMIQEYKFITEIEKCVEESSGCTLICNTDGIILETCKATLYRFPECQETMELQRLLGVRVVDTLADAENGAMCVKIQRSASADRHANHRDGDRDRQGQGQNMNEDNFNRRQVVCTFQRYQINYRNHTERDKQNMLGNNNYYEQLFVIDASCERKFIGILVSITEECGNGNGGVSLKNLNRIKNSNSYIKSSDYRAKNTMSKVSVKNIRNHQRDRYDKEDKEDKEDKFDTQTLHMKRTNMLSKLTLAIESIYDQAQVEQVSNAQSFNTYQQGGYGQNWVERGVYQSNPYYAPGNSNGQGKQGQSRINYELYINDNDKQCHIKTFRYWLGDYIRIYEDGLLEQESDYDFEEKIADLEAKLNKEKMQDVDYQERIKKSINTFIYHPQIISLFNKGLMLFILFVALNIVQYYHYKNKSISEGLSKLNTKVLNMEDVEVISLGLSQIMFESGLSNRTYGLIKEHVVHFEPIAESDKYAMIDGYMLQDFTHGQVEIMNSVIRVQANIVRCAEYLNMVDAQQANRTMNSTSADSDSNRRYRTIQRLLQTSYISYVTKILQTVYNNFPTSQEQTNNDPSNTIQDFNYTSFIFMSFFSIVFVVLWIYEDLTLKHKICEILIWFLDIPFDYINFAQKQCHHFNKNYMESQKISEKPLSQLSECEHFVQQYKEKQPLEQALGSGSQVNSSNSSSQNPSLSASDNQSSTKTQNSKTRQILISRYRKQGLLSMFSFMQLNKLSIYIILNIFILVLVLMHEYLQRQNLAISNSVNSYVREYVLVQSIPIVLRVMKDKQTQNNMWEHIGMDQLGTVLRQSKRRLLIQAKTQSSSVRKNMISTLETIDANSLQQYLQFQYSDICDPSYSNSSVAPECDTLIKSRLKGGYSILLEYIKSIEQATISQQEIKELERALRLYALPKMMKLLTSMIDGLKTNIQSIDFKITISFYMFMVIVGIVFVGPWNLYLRRMNLLINQTIQILNVVPITLIPVARKETRDFLKWLVLKSSKVNQEY